jgi:hypothetical protein
VHHDDMTHDDAGQRRYDRRRILTGGGLVAGGAIVGGVVQAGSAAAQTSTPGLYLPVGPVRVFDSRSPGAGGPIGRGQTVGLQTSFQTLDPVPFGVTLNVTVTNTVGKGWLALYPSDVSFGGTSTLNWFGDAQDLANNAFVGVASNGIIMIAAGGTLGAQADFVIDLTGVSAAVDAGTASASGYRDALTAPWSLA